MSDSPFVMLPNPKSLDDEIEEVLVMVNNTLENLQPGLEEQSLSSQLQYLQALALLKIGAELERIGQ